MTKQARKGYPKGAVASRSHGQNTKTGLWTKRDTSGRFTSVKRSGGTFKGIRRER